MAEGHQSDDQVRDGQKDQQREQRRSSGSPGRRPLEHRDGAEVDQPGQDGAAVGQRVQVQVGPPQEARQHDVGSEEQRRQESRDPAERPTAGGGRPEGVAPTEQKHLHGNYNTCGL